MGSCSGEEEQDLFFDTREEITSISDSGSDCPDRLDVNCTSFRNDNEVLGSFRYEVWMRTPTSVSERRHRFFKWMGLSIGRSESGYLAGDEFSAESDRIMESSGAVLGNSDQGEGYSISQSSLSCSSNVGRDTLENAGLNENFVCRIKNLDDGTEFLVDESRQDGTLCRLREVGSNRLISGEEFQRSLGLSPLVQQLMRREAVEANNLLEVTKSVRRGWLRRLGIVACMANKQDDEGKELKHNEDPDVIARTRIQRVKVRQCRKRSKELSALYMGQDIQAHEGSILTMKFSPDGQYLASAGEDGIVRVWQVLDSERSSECDVPQTDPSCIYFALNHSSELAPISSDKEKMNKFKSLKRTSDSACVILPPRVLRISEKPLHEFHGHTDEVLDLSWSNNKCLLSSSIDKTVRLWKLGCDQCLRVFSHNNYVTCVQFNPMDDNFFVSGSIDGKVRIWTIPDCQVVDWTDVTEIVTAVCYRTDGQGGVIGSMTGNCYFFDALDNHLQLGTQICLQGKKKFPGKRITGFQFCPSDASKLMVTSADSHVRILDGNDVVCKYRGLRNAGSQIAASFTSDGKHIVSASEDSNVYIWNYSTQDGPTSSQAKSVWSCERFFSSNASVAIPWCGRAPGSSIFSTVSGMHPFHQVSTTSQGNSPECRWQDFDLDVNLREVQSLSSRECFSLGHGLFSESFPKGSATWPEEKLPNSSSLTMSFAMCKSQYKFLKTSCQSTSVSPHAWGQVFVTAGRDGRIRSFHNYGLPVRL